MESVLKTFNNKINVEHYVSRFEEIKERFKDTGVNAENISIVLLSIMMEARTMKKLSGSEKKMLVTKLITHIALELCTTENQPALKEIIQFTVPTLIDNFVEISKSVNFKKIKMWFSCC